MSSSSPSPSASPLPDDKEDEEDEVVQPLSSSPAPTPLVSSSTSSQIQIINSNSNHNHQTTSSKPLVISAGEALVSGNTRRIGKRYYIRLLKRKNGLGFSITTRDNPAGGKCPIYIKNILPHGSALFDGRLRQGDRLLEVNGVEMTGKSQEEAVEFLKTIEENTYADMIVSRQEVLLPADPLPSPRRPRPLHPDKVDTECDFDDDFDHLDLSTTGGTSSTTTGSSDPIGVTEEGSNSNRNSLHHREMKREVLTFEIPLNNTGSAGLGVAVKGKTHQMNKKTLSLNSSFNDSFNLSSSSPTTTSDLGIFVQTVFHGGAAHKDGRLRKNDQLLSINGIPLLGLSNAEAMETLRQTMLNPTDGPTAIEGAIVLTVARRQLDNMNSSFLNDSACQRPASQADQIDVKESEETVSSPSILTDGVVVEPTIQEDNPDAFTRDGFGRKSMSEKRHAHLDAKNTDTYQSIRRAREEKETSSSVQVDVSNVKQDVDGQGQEERRQTDDEEEEVLSHPNSQDNPVAMSTQVKQLTFEEELENHHRQLKQQQQQQQQQQQNQNFVEDCLMSTPSMRTKTATKSFLSPTSPLCCWSCNQSPGSCPYHPSRGFPSSSINGAATSPAGPVSSRSVPRLSHHDGRDGSSLENLQSLLKEIQTLHRHQRQHNQDPMMSRPSTLKVRSRSRATNDSFRAAVDRSYDTVTGLQSYHSVHHPNSLPLDDSMNPFNHHLQLIQQQSYPPHPSSHNHRQPNNNHHHYLYRDEKETEEREPSSSGIKVGCFSSSSNARGPSGLDLQSQSTALTSLTGTTTTSSANTTDDDVSFCRDDRRSRSSRDRRGEKKGFINKFFKFGSRKCRTPPASSTVHPTMNAPTVAQIIQELEMDAEKIKARRQALSEQERIQEHVRRLKEQQEQLMLRHHQQQQQVHVIQQVNGPHPATESTFEDKYGHYMNHQEIQEQLQTLYQLHPPSTHHQPVVALSNRPLRHPLLHSSSNNRHIPLSTQNLNPPPLPPGRPVSMHTTSSGSVIRPIPAPKPTMTLIDARGVNGHPPTTRSHYYEYEGSAPSAGNGRVVPPQYMIAVSPNDVYESRVALQQQMQQAKPNPSSGIYVSHPGNNRSQPTTTTHVIHYPTREGPYGVIGGSSIMPKTVPIQVTQPTGSSTVRVRQQPVYQAQNVYVYSTPPSSYQRAIHHESIYGTRPVVIQQQPIYGSHPVSGGQYLRPEVSSSRIVQTNGHQPSSYIHLPE